MTQFINLHTQTNYSILDSIIDVKPLFKRAKELGQTAIAITDHGSLAATWEALKVSKDTGVKLIIGCELYFKEENDEKLRHIILIAKNAEGYKNLLTINKKGFDNGLYTGKRVYPVVNWNILKEYSKGVICLTACGNGILSQLLMSKKNEEAERTLLQLIEIYGENLALEVQPNNMRRGSNVYNDEIDQMFLNRRLIDLGKKFNVKVVPACNAHYLLKEDAPTHDVLLAIGSHQPIYSNFRLKYPVDEFYLKSGSEVKSFFSRNYGENYAEEICQNTIHFADQCEFPDWIDPKFSNTSGKELPSFPLKDEPDYSDFCDWLSNRADLKDLEEDKNYLRYKSELSLNKYFSKNNFDDETKKVYTDRIEEELDVFYYCGVSSYMLIVADYINWCKNNEVTTGPGRGSAGGSFIAFLLGIHDADSIKYGLVFPRFFNKLKKDFADIDVDVSKSGREKVIQYLVTKYGEDNVAHISNLNTITPKVYVKDVARAHESGGSKDTAVKIGTDAADSIATDIKSIDDALKKSPIFMEYCKRYPELSKNKSICGAYRAWSTHAAGIVISKRPLVGLVPLRKDKDGNIAIEYDKGDTEENGLIKMDVLGIETLDIVDNTFSLIKMQGKQVPTIDYEEYDEKTYDLISSGNTFGVFQFGTSQGTMDLCIKIKPKCMEDLALITTLTRPGSSKEVRENFIKTREGKRTQVLLHPSLKNALEKTLNFPLYDESLLVLAKDVAGWNYAEADKLRKLTKEKGKNPENAKRWMKEFIEGAVKNGLNDVIATRIWEEIVGPFGNYSFNKSHAILYSILTYKTAYLKAHFPVEFLLANLMAAVKSNALNADEKIAKVKHEIRKNKIKILPPNVNTSNTIYTLDVNTLLTGLDALKSVGDEAIKDIVEKRPFKSFLDFMHRVDSSKVRANTIQALVAAGALDCFGLSRKSMFLYCSDYRKKLQSWGKRHDIETEVFEYPFPKESEWSLSELFALETECMGEAFICRPNFAYKEFFKTVHKTIYDIKKSENRTKLFPIKAIIREVFEFKVKKETSKYYGQSMVKCKIEDKSGDLCSCTIFPDRFTAAQKRIKDINSKAKFEPGLAISFGGTVNIYEDEPGIILEEIFDISLPPQMPDDKKHKKVSLREAKPVKEDILNKSNLEENIEDELYDLGLIDLEEPEESD